MKIDFKIKERSLVAKLAAWKLRGDKAAIVIGKTIHLHNTTTSELLENKPWLCHELKHVQQFSQYGFFPFIGMYLWESLLHGYTNNKYEKEARLAEQDEELLNNMNR